MPDVADSQQADDFVELQKYYAILVSATTHHPRIFNLEPRETQGRLCSLLLRIVARIRGRWFHA